MKLVYYFSNTGHLENNPDTNACNKRPSLPSLMFDPCHLLSPQTDMTAAKGGVSSSQPGPECCMCGDCGLPYELFQCKACQFRSQHRYCSNLYPKAESYQVCNWCLSHDIKEKSQNSSSSIRNSSEDDSKKKKGDNQAGLSKSHRGTLQLQINSPIKKQRSPERSPSIRRRLITNGRLEEKLRRTKSEEILNNGITKQVFRNKVRRYKLLDEVSS